MIRPTLAATATSLSQLRFPCAATPKIDGIRALTWDSGFRSRAWKLLPNEHCQRMAAQLPSRLDGELVYGDFNSTQSAVMSVDGEPALTYMVFDQCVPGTYWERIHSLPPLPSWCTVLLPTVLHSVDDFTAYEESCVTQGYEGVMLRDATAQYMHKRSSLREYVLVKYKRFVDSEGVVIGYKEGVTNDNSPEQDAWGYQKRSGHTAGKLGRDTLGSLTLDDNGVRVSVGSGLTEAQRAALWADRDNLIGRVVKYKYQHAEGCAPRFPRFVGFVL